MKIYRLFNYKKSKFYIRKFEIKMNLMKFYHFLNYEIFEFYIRKFGIKNEIYKILSSF
jgi:hypothetical protein